jgi:hypothetical protein
MDNGRQRDAGCGHPYHDAPADPIDAPDARCDARSMAHELTIDQMREIVRLRRRNPRADVLVHQKQWGLIVEARRSGHTIELERFDWTGAVTPDQQIALAA